MIRERKGVDACRKNSLLSRVWRVIVKIRETQIPLDNINHDEK